MSKKINVNPDHYKTAGRERQGENIVQADEKQELRKREKSVRNFIPGAAPVGESKKRGSK